MIWRTVATTTCYSYTDRVIIWIWISCGKWWISKRLLAANGPRQFIKGILLLPSPAVKASVATLAAPGGGAGGFRHGDPLQRSESGFRPGVPPAPVGRSRLPPVGDAAGGWGEDES